MIMKSSLGIKAHFFVAFGVLSTLMLLGSMISWFSYDRLGNELNQVVEGNIQALSLMSEFKEQGTKITLVAPTLLASKDEAGRQLTKTKLDTDILFMTETLETLSDKTSDKVRSTLLIQMETLQKQINTLNTNVVHKLEVQKQKRTENRRLRWIAASFLSDMDALIENTQKQLTLYFNQDFPDSWIRMQGYLHNDIATINKNLQLLFRVKADVTLLISLVDRAQHLPDLNSLIATQAHTDEISARINSNIRTLETLTGIQEVKRSIYNILFLTKGENNMFSIRSKERTVLASGENQLTLIGNELDTLNALINQQADTVEKAAQESSINAQNTIKKARIWMLLMVVASLIVSILVIWLYVGRNMVARITQLDSDMRAIARGNLNQNVEIGGDDEIGTMAKSLISFRDQLSTLQEELVQAGKLAALGQLSAGIAHEINQPLSAINHYSHNGSRLLNSGNTEAAENNFIQISRLTKRATNIITRLRSMAQKQPTNLVPVNVETVVENVLGIMAGDAIKKQTDIQVDFLQRDNIVKVDPVQLEQVVLNLITNALQAISEQENKQIHIICDHNQDRLTLSVTDSGQGISDEALDKLFEPFFTTKPRGESLGLGLSISYNIIKRFGGKLTVENTPNQGATFCIHLPLSRSN